MRMKFSSKQCEKSTEGLEYLTDCTTVKDSKDFLSPSNTGRSAVFFRRCLTLRVQRPSAPGLDAEPGEQLSGVKFLWRGMRQTGQSPVLSAAAGMNATNAVVNVFLFFFPPSTQSDHIPAVQGWLKAGFDCHVHRHNHPLKLSLALWVQYLSDMITRNNCYLKEVLLEEGKVMYLLKVTCSGARSVCY